MLQMGTLDLRELEVYGFESTKIQLKIQFDYFELN